MGERVSIQFQKNNDILETPTQKSVVLYSHWGYLDFPREALRYAIQLKKRSGGRTMYPLERLEVGVVMVDFIRHITQSESEIKSNYYLGKDENSGDNSDWGHWIIDLDDMKLIAPEGHKIALEDFVVREL